MPITREGKKTADKKERLHALALLSDWMGFFSGVLLDPPLYANMPDVQRLIRTVQLSTASHNHLFARSAFF